MRKRKSDVASSGLLTHIAVSRTIPDRLLPLYYQILGDYNYQDATAGEQLAITKIAWLTCKEYQLEEKLRDEPLREDDFKQLAPLHRMLREWIATLTGQGKTADKDKDLVSELAEYQNG